MSSKTCPYCHYNIVRKNGYTSSGRTRYRCLNCKKSWTNKARPLGRNKAIWQDFTWGKLTAEELGKKYGCHPNTIRKILHEHRVKPLDLNELTKEQKASITVIALDTTYFGKSYAIVTAIDAHTGRLLYFQPIEHIETNADYYQAITTIETAGIHPKAAVIDGRKGVKELLESHGIIVQYCLFHFSTLGRRCLTKDPVLEPNKEMKQIIYMLYNKHHIYTKEQFSNAFFSWMLRYGMWLEERTQLEGGKWEYTHKRTRILAKSIERHLDHLFTYETYPELNIPRESNRIEGKFGNAKDRMRLHHGYTKELKTKIIFTLLSEHTEK